MSDIKLWSKSFTAVFFSNFFTAHSFYILMVCMPFFVMDELNLNEYHVGLVMGVFSITGVLIRPFAGVMVDSLGRLKIFILAVALFTLCTVSYIYAFSFASIVLIRLIHGLGWGLTSTAGSTIAADVVPVSRRAEGLGYYAMSMSIGMALGPALGVFLWDKLPYQQVFLFCTALSCCAFLAAFFINEPFFEKSRVNFSLSNLIEKRVLGISFMQFSYGITYGSLMSFILIYGKQLGIENSGLFFMILAVVTTIVRPLVGKIADRHGPGNMMGIGFIVLIVAILMLVYVKGPILYFSAAAVVGLGAAIVMPLFVAMAMNVVKPNRRGAANATIFMAFDAGIGIGAVVFGKIAVLSSISTMYLVAAGILIIPLAFYYIYERAHYTKLTEENQSAA